MRTHHLLILQLILIKVQFVNLILKNEIYNYKRTIKDNKDIKINI